MESMCVATGYGCKEVYRFPHTTYPYFSCICSFLQQHHYFLFIFKMFFVLVPVLFVITFDVLNNFVVQYKRTYRQLRGSLGREIGSSYSCIICAR